MNKYIKLVTILGLISIILIQSIWLTNTYKILKDKTITESSKLLREAINIEAFTRLDTMDVSPEGIVVSSDKNNNTKVEVQIEYIQEAALKLGSDISLFQLHNIYSSLLKKNNLPDAIRINKIDTNENSIISYEGEQNYSFWSIHTQLVPIRIDKSITIQAILLNPIEDICTQMGILIIATVIMMIFVIACIVYQINIIIKQKKIFQIREDFSYAMIHDMKTPLSTIFMTLNFLHSGRLDDKPEMKDKYFQIAKSEADHLLTLTNKVLTISKLEQHKLEMDMTDVELKPIIDKLTERFTTKASKPVIFTVNIKVPVIYADAEYIEEVLSNLIDNAIKYSKDSVEIKISSECDELNTILKVHDNGLGISETDQRIIFNKYERGMSSNKRKRHGVAGFGLGLNFVEQVIEAHDGKIIVNSIEDEFTEFIIYIPRIIQPI